MQHVAVIYGGSSAEFYFVEQSQMGLFQSLAFMFYITFQQAYFMGIMFLIAGFFTAGSYNRKGFTRFIRERFKRLIIPALIFIVFISPFIKYVQLGVKISDDSLIDFILSFSVMWFTIALFIFSFIYGCIRKLSHKDIPDRQNTNINTSFSNLLVLILFIAICAFLIRIFIPIPVKFAGIRIGFFASYVILFIVGIFSYRCDLFTQIRYRTGKRWLIGGIVISCVGWYALAWTAILTGNISAGEGGINAFSAVFALWESFTAIAICVGLIGTFKEKFNKQNKLVKAMSDSSFAVFMFHPPIVVGLVLLFRPVILPPIVKFYILCPICIVLSFLVAHFVVRKIPLLKEIL